MSEFAKASFKKRVLARVLVRPQQEPAQKPPYGTWSQGGLGGPCSGGIQAPFRHHPPPRGGGGYSLRRTANRAPCMMVKTIVAPVRTFRPRRRTGLVCVVFVVRTGCAHGGEGYSLRRPARRAPCMMVKTIVAPMRIFWPRRRTGVVFVQCGEHVKIRRAFWPRRRTGVVFVVRGPNRMYP